MAKEPSRTSTLKTYDALPITLLDREGLEVTCLNCEGVFYIMSPNRWRSRWKVKPGQGPTYTGGYTRPCPYCFKVSKTRG